MTTTSIAGRTWHFSHALGRQTGEHNGNTGGFYHPVDVAIAPDGHLFVVSRGIGFGVEGFGGDFLLRIGKTTIDEHHIGDFARCAFVWPAGIAVSRDGNVYVTDEFTHDVTIFAPDRIMTFPEHEPDESIDRWGQSGADPGQLNGPSGIKFDADDNVLISDSGNDRIQKFTKNGEYITSWGGTGSGEGEFSRPWGLCLDKDGSVYVADWGNNRVQKFTQDGDYLMSFGSSEDDGGDLDHPAAVAVDSEGDVYVSDWGNRRVQIFEASGDVIAALYGDVNRLSKATEYSLGRNGGVYRHVFDDTVDAMTRVKEFERPHGLVVDDQDRVIITDSCGRLQVYVKDNDWVDPVPA